MSDTKLEDTSFITEPQEGLPDPVTELPVDAVRLLSINGTVLKLSIYDGQKIDTSGCYLATDPVVPVTDDGGNVLGTAFLKIEGEDLVAESTINYASPERLSLENGDKFYFIMNGDIIVTGGDKWRPMKGSAIRIKNLLLTQFASSDKRIEPVNYSI